MANLDENTFLGMFLNFNNEVIDTCVFSNEATQEEIQNILEIKKTFNPNVFNLITSTEYGIGSVGWELYNNYLREQQPFLSFTWNEEKRQWVAPVAYPSNTPEDVLFYLWSEELLNWYPVSKNIEET